MVNPQTFDDGIKQLELFQPLNTSKPILSDKERRAKNISIWIGDCMISADWDDDGQIDYEEFLRALHPRFNEHPVTPKALSTPSKQIEPKFIFQPSLATGINYNNSEKNTENSDDETNKKQFEQYMIH